MNIKTQILSKKEFENKKRLLNELRKNQNKKRKIKVIYKDIDESKYMNEPFLKHISEREE